MLLKCLCLVLVLGFSHASSEVFSCVDLLPERRDAEVKDSRDYPLFTQVSKNSYAPNEKIEVTLSIRGEVDIRFFIAQMRVANSDAIRGTWLADDPIASTGSCTHEADTMFNAGSETLTRLAVTWVAPHHASETGNEAVELKVTIMTEEGDYWTTDSPILLREREASESTNEEQEQPSNEKEAEEEDKTTEDADNDGKEAAEQDKESRRRDENDHGLRVEIEMIKTREEHLAKEIEAEDRASEGDWSITMEEERKQREEELKKEMYEYESQKAAEDEARLERIREEIRDKEEWEALQPKLLKPTHAPTTTKKRENPKDENEIDYGKSVGSDGSSAAMATASVLSLLFALFCTMF